MPSSCNRPVHKVSCTISYLSSYIFLDDLIHHSNTVVHIYVSGITVLNHYAVVYISTHTCPNYGISNTQCAAAVPAAACCVLLAACCVLCAVCCVLCALCCVLCAVCSVLCAVCCVLCAVCCVLCAVCCLLCAACCVLNESYMMCIM